MRIIYKGIRSGKSRVAIITYADNEENKAYDIAINIRNMTSYKVDTGVSGMIIIDVDDMNDYNNLKEWYKKFKKTSCDETSTENDNEESDNTKENDNETATDSADNNETPNKTPAELKAEINKKYGVNAVYYDTDSVLCDAEKQNVCVHHNKTTDNEVYATTTKIIIRDVCDSNEICTITPYENGKELTTSISKMKCLTNVIDYVKRLFDMNVVTRETYFTIFRIGKRNVVLTYTNTHNIVQYYNISGQMRALATTAIEQYGYYSKYTRKSLKSRQYDVLELYKKGIYLTISQCNDDEIVIKDWYCDITYNSAHHIGQYTYKELLHLIDNIRYNTQEYCDKYFDWGVTMDIIKQVEHNIDMICDGLKNDSYKKVRVGYIGIHLHAKLF